MPFSMRVQIFDWFRGEVAKVEEETCGGGGERLGMTERSGFGRLWQLWSRTGFAASSLLPAWLAYAPVVFIVLLLPLRLSLLFALVVCFHSADTDSAAAATWCCVLVDDGFFHHHCYLLIRNPRPSLSSLALINEKKVLVVIIKKIKKKHLGVRTHIGFFFTFVTDYR